MRGSYSFLIVIISQDLEIQCQSNSVIKTVRWKHLELLGKLPSLLGRNPSKGSWVLKVFIAPPKESLLFMQGADGPPRNNKCMLSLFWITSRISGANYHARQTVFFFKCPASSPAEKQNSVELITRKWWNFMAALKILSELFVINSSLLLLFGKSFQSRKTKGLRNVQNLPY